MMFLCIVISVEIPLSYLPGILPGGVLLYRSLVCGGTKLIAAVPCLCI